MEIRCWGCGISKGEGIGKQVVRTFVYLQPETNKDFKREIMDEDTPLLHEYSPAQPGKAHHSHEYPQ